MRSDYRCYFCFARLFENLIEKTNLTPEEKQCFASQMFGLFHSEKDGFSVPYLSREVHLLFKKYSDNDDPYKWVKRQSNDMVLSRYDDLKKTVTTSADPFVTALKLAIAGNIIDYGIPQHFDLDETIGKVLASDFAIDHSKDLKQSLSEAKSVLYIGDYAGEIVFDKLFIETIHHHDLWYAVRGAPIINDVTLEDANYVQMNEVAHVIENGYDAPSTMLSHCSKEFKDLFSRADIVISKGQGNLESLLHESSKKIYFLLMVKCDVIADILGVKKGQFVVARNVVENENCHSKRKGRHRQNVCLDQSFLDGATFRNSDNAD
ncbi:MAG: ARMT1-like domain-containing protein [Dysgonamonadaceae bacterium]